MSFGVQESVPDWLPRILQRVEGFTVHSRPGLHSVSVSVNGGRATDFEVFTIPILSQEYAKQLINHWRSSEPDSTRRHRLIASRHLSLATRELLRENGISWVDERSGICRLVAPGLLVDIKTEGTGQKEPAVRARLRDRSGVLAEVLLLNFLQRDIRLASVAKQANVSTALASRILARLAKLKLLDTHAAGPQRFWKISNVGGLLDLWATEEQPVEHSTGIYLWSRSPHELLRKLPLLNKLSVPWALASTAAANLYAPTLTTFPDPSVWIESSAAIREVARVLGGELVDKGANLQILQSKNDLAFANAILWTSANTPADFTVEDLRIVSRPRAYVETINAPGRGPEVAQNLRQRILADGVS